MNGTVSREQFEHLTPEQQLFLIFETLEARLVKCDTRFKVLESPKKRAINGILAWAGAFTGAAGTVFVLFKWYIPDKIEAMLPRIVKEILPSVLNQ